MQDSHQHLELIARLTSRRPWTCTFGVGSMLSSFLLYTNSRMLANSRFVRQLKPSETTHTFGTHPFAKGVVVGPVMIQPAYTRGDSNLQSPGSLALSGVVPWGEITQDYGYLVASGNLHHEKANEAMNDRKLAGIGHG